MSADRAGRREAVCRWHTNERRSHLPIRSVLPVCHWQTAPEPAGETAGAAPPFVLRCARRSAKQKKAVPAKNSEANFWRPRFTWPLRAGKRANARFACSEGFFCARRAAPSAGAAVLVPPAAVVVDFVPGAPAFFLPVLRCLVPGLRAVCCFCAWSGLRCRGLLAGNVPACFLAPHFSFIFCLFPPDFCLSNLFSLVAQAATGLYFLPKRK